MPEHEWSDKLECILSAADLAIVMRDERSAERVLTLQRTRMHEASLAQDLLVLIEETARANFVRSVTRATIEIGALSCVSPDALQFAFEAMRRGTLAESCQLVIERTPLRVSCPACGAEGATTAEDPSCPKCRQIPVEVLSGREMRLVSIDVEDDQPNA